jgi:hypothetical protein
MEWFKLLLFNSNILPTKQISKMCAVIGKICLSFKLVAALLDIHLSHLNNVQPSCLLWGTGCNVLRYLFVLYVEFGHTCIVGRHRSLQYEPYINLFQSESTRGCNIILYLKFKISNEKARIILYMVYQVISICMYTVLPGWCDHSFRSFGDIIKIYKKI